MHIVRVKAFEKSALSAIRGVVFDIGNTKAVKGTGWAVGPIVDFKFKTEEDSLLFINIAKGHAGWELIAQRDQGSI